MLVPSTAFSTMVSTPVFVIVASLGDTGDNGSYIMVDNVQYIGTKNVNSSGAHSHTITGGDTETRPINRAYQLYTIVDTY